MTTRARRSWTSGTHRRVLARFQSLKVGAHKADVFRYCYLRIHGGIYMDVKTVLTRDVANMFPDRLKAHTVLSWATTAGRSDTEVYQGIIASPPNNAFFDSLIQHVVETSNWDLGIDYLSFTKEFGVKLATDLGTLKLTLGEHPVVATKTTSLRCNWVLWGEIEADDAMATCGGYDRYGFCMIMKDKDGKTLGQIRDIRFGSSW